MENLTVNEAYNRCLNEHGRVDLEYISSVTEKDIEDVIEELGDQIFQDPLLSGKNLYKGWVRAEEYLSGNIRVKLADARLATKMYPGIFERNVEALEKVMPQTISEEDIYVTLGSPWVPTEIIGDFLRMISNTRLSRNKCTVRHDDITGTWKINIGQMQFGWDYAFNSIYGTERISAIDIFRKTINMKPITIMDEVIADETKGRYKRVLNLEETAYAKEKQKLMIEAFSNWVWRDKRRKEKMLNAYNQKYGCLKTRVYDGNFLTFPGMNRDFSLYGYQREAVARILFSKNTLLAHEVGTGKTFIMIAAGMELKRMRQSNKEEKLLYVVPNSIIGQWADMFTSLYPEARVFAVGANLFTPQKRQETLRRIKNETFDAIIMTHSCFSEVEMSPDAKREIINNEMKRLSVAASVATFSYSGLPDPLHSQIKKMKKQLESMEISNNNDPDHVFFDDLEITRLFVDEAHYFKNVPIKTDLGNVKGINTKGSAKCEDMLDKIRLIQNRNDGGGIVLATGTPITNSITDAFIMQKYVQNSTLQKMGLESFDSWAAMFAEIDDGFEIDVDTSKYRKATRFSKFHNIPELTALLMDVIDFHENDNDADIPDHDGYKDIVIPKTPEFEKYLNEISNRADDIRNKVVDKSEDNMLKLTVDGRKAALDLRLINEKLYEFSPISKVYYCAEKVNEIYKRTAKDNSTQLVFCDTSVPGEGFNIYSELKRLLVQMGVSEDDIAFIHDANNEKKRETLFEKVRHGEIRILIGSTFKLGVGVNVQDKLIALHHLDIPWRPADVGRILRTFKIKKNVEVTDNGKIII